MNTAGQSETSDARRLVEASAWRTYLAEKDLESTPAFETWLKSDNRNQAAWENVQRSWDLFGDHATTPELLDLRRRALGSARSLGQQRWATRYSWISRFRRAAIAAGILIIAAGAAITFSVLRPDVYRTNAGERRVVTLADGSQVQLDSLTELHVSYSERARDLKLIRGQARFDVAHDVERPFSVLAAQKKVVATGTAFNVDLLGKNLYVTLLEGSVVILPQAAAQSRVAEITSPEAVPKREDVRLEAIELAAGEQLAVSADGATRITPASVQRTTAWQSGQLVFENEPLSAAVARVNRYSAQPVTLADEKVASLRISGVFNTGDTAGFVSTITHYLPIKAEQSGDAIHLSSNNHVMQMPECR